MGVKITQNWPQIFVDFGKFWISNFKHSRVATPLPPQHRMKLDETLWKCSSWSEDHFHKVWADFMQPSGGIACPQEMSISKTGGVVYRAPLYMYILSLIRNTGRKSAILTDQKFPMAPHGSPMGHSGEIAILGVKNRPKSSFLKTLVYTVYWTDMGVPLHVF